MDSTVSSIFRMILVLWIWTSWTCSGDQRDASRDGHALKLSHFKATHSSAVGHCNQKFGGNLFPILSLNDVELLKRVMHGRKIANLPVHIMTNTATAHGSNWTSLSEKDRSSPKRNMAVANDEDNCVAIIATERATRFRRISCDTKLHFVCHTQILEPKRERQKHRDKRAASYSFLFVNKNLLKIVAPQAVFDTNACKSFAKDNYENNLASRVVGGETALYGSQPWQVEIAQLRNGRTQHHCSGVIVSERFVLSTAHCFSKSHDRYLQSLRVITGDHDIELRDKHEAEYEIEKVAIHPKHLASLYTNDIAVIKLKAKMGRGIVFGSHVKPACMPRYDTPHQSGTECEVSGWGLTEDSLMANVSTVLRSARVNLMSTAQCSELYKNYNPVNEGMLCAGHLRGGIDSCHGDSGGPLVCNTTGTVRLFGLVSWGDGCALPNRPGVYVRIQHYLKWIADKIGEMS